VRRVRDTRSSRESAGANHARSISPGSWSSEGGAASWGPVCWEAPAGESGVETGTGGGEVGSPTSPGAAGATGSAPRTAGRGLAIQTASTHTAASRSRLQLTRVPSASDCCSMRIGRIGPALNTGIREA
jgi:hypothetical protein